MKHKDSQPFRNPVGDSIGRGKDNVVAPFRGVDSDKVLKWNHDPTEYTTSEEHFLRLQYKKKKYELLKVFLGDFIPKTYFVLGNKNDNGKTKIKEYTVQQRVPNVRVASLPTELKTDPILLNNLHLLIMKLRAMYQLLERVNIAISDDAALDGKLDLGGLSEIARSHDLKDSDFDFGDGEYNFMNSPNLLVDPQTLQLYCIDFDQGVWSSAKEATLILVKALVQNSVEMRNLSTRKQEVRTHVTT